MVLLSSDGDRLGKGFLHKFNHILQCALIALQDSPGSEHNPTLTMGLKFDKQGNILPVVLLSSLHLLPVFLQKMLCEK
jgi:hypothetical protein